MGIQMRIISVINQKGGVGKTTTTANLAHALALAGNRVTVIDMDPQSHLGTSLGVNGREYSGVDEVLLEGAAIEDVMISVRDNLVLIPAGTELNRIEQLGNGGLKKGELLKQALKGKLSEQDFVLIDCPPSSGLLAINALIASHEVLIPVTGDYLSLEGLSFLMATIKTFKNKLGYSLREWIVVTRFHKRRRLGKEVLAKLLHYFPDNVLATQIRETAALAECPGRGNTIFEYRSKSNGAIDYKTLAADLMYSRTVLKGFDPDFTQKLADDFANKQVGFPETVEVSEELTA